MVAEILECKSLRDEILKPIKEHYFKNHANGSLVVVSIGSDPASEAYVRSKKNTARECCIPFEHYTFSADVDFKTIKEKFYGIANCKYTSGIILQLPTKLSYEEEQELIELIPDWKDIDGLKESKMYLNDTQAKYIPCTPQGIMRLLAWKHIPWIGKHVVVMGRSNLVGKPIANLLIQHGATVTVCNSLTENPLQYTSRADIIISAVGKPEFITKSCIKKGAICIDVGITRMDDGKLHGDFSPNVADIAKMITPVPGGIGLLTVACLMYNYWKADSGIKR